MNQSPSLVRIGGRIINISQVHQIKMIASDYVVITFNAEHTMILHGDEATIFWNQVTQMMELKNE
ncbi:hypothetical protein [Nodularia chucula]|uniref:hypothetical protein n=1 Tax=Nodularia chucula TaxID=3093667 RepID=UPI0039C60F7B